MSVDTNPGIPRIFDLVKKLPKPVRENIGWSAFSLFFLGTGSVAGLAAYQIYNQNRAFSDYYTPARLEEARTSKQAFEQSLEEQVRAGTYGESLQQDLALIDQDRRTKAAYQRYDQFTDQALSRARTGQYSESLQTKLTTINSAANKSRFLDWEILSVGAMTTLINMGIGLGIARFQISR